MVLPKILILMIILVVPVVAVSDSMSSDERYWLSSADSPKRIEEVSSSVSNTRESTVSRKGKMKSIHSLKGEVKVKDFNTKKRKQWNRQIGSQTNEAKLKRKAQQLLKTKGNGIADEEQAKKAAKEFLENVRLKRNEKDRRNYKGPKRDAIRFSAGYQSKKQRIQRSIETFQKKDPTLTDPKAREMAGKHYEAEQERRRVYQAKYNANKRKRVNGV